VTPEVVRGDPARPLVALTLDAGAGAAPAVSMLDTLAARQVRLTFFLTGQWSQQNPDLVQRIHAEGHEIANHSFRHPDFRTLSDEEIAEEIYGTEGLILQLTSTSTRPWFRFPYGARDARVLDAVNSHGFTSVFWTLDVLDSVGAPKTPQFIYDRVVANLGPGAIILAHVGNPATAAALPGILDYFQQRGLQAVTVSQLVA
jgi:peptidoglycan/xylan/chitin deacetylase (PgdA/CDA1 family)